MSAASARIDELLAKAKNQPKPAPRPLPQIPERGDLLRFWYYAHPIMVRTFGPNAATPLEGAVEAHYMGEWPIAVQKLMAAFAANELPDVGMVKRDLVATLYESRRIRPLDGLLPQSLLDDLRPEVIADYSYEGHQIALPADGFCSVLFFNKHSVGVTPPKTWTFFTAYVNAQYLSPGPAFPRGLGAFPFMEALWSADGDVLVNGSSGLGRPEAVRALNYVLDITRNTVKSEDAAFQLWVTGQLAMTVASSSHVPAANAAGFAYGLAPVPGETGPISRRSNDAVVVFAREGGADAARIAAFLDWLSGPRVLGERAAADGSVPLRESTREFESLIPEVTEAYKAARNTPLHPEWGAIESEAMLGLAEAYASSK